MVRWKTFVYEAQKIACDVLFGSTFLYAFVLVVRAVEVINNPNCAFYDTSMKLVSLVEFEVLKKIGSGTQYQSASKHDFQAFRFGLRPPGSFLRNLSSSHGLIRSDRAVKLKLSGLS